MLKHQPVAWDSFQKRSPLQGNRPILCSWQYHSVTWSLYSFRLFAGHFYRNSFGSSNNFITTGIAVAFACEEIKKLGNFVLPMNTHLVRDGAKDCHLVFPLSGHPQGWSKVLEKVGSWDLTVLRGWNVVSLKCDWLICSRNLTPDLRRKEQQKAGVWLSDRVPAWKAQGPGFHPQCHNKNILKYNCEGWAEEVWPIPTLANDQDLSIISNNAPLDWLCEVCSGC